MNLMNAITLATSALAVAGGMASSAHANKVTFPVTINKANQAIVQLKVNGMVIKALLDTGFNDRIIFGMKAAAALKLPDNGMAPGANGIGGAAATNNTKVPAGSSIVGAMGMAAVAPVDGAGFFFPNMNFGNFDAIVGATFLNTSDATGAFVLNAAKGTGTIYDKAQAAKLALLPLNTPTTAVATGSLDIPGQGMPPSATVSLVNGAHSASAPFILSTGVSDTLISQTVANSLGPLTVGPSETVTSELGSFTVSTAILQLGVFSQQSPSTMTVGILPDSLNPDNINVIGMDFYSHYSELIWNGANSTFSAMGVPEPGTWSIFLVGFGVLGLHFRQRRAHQYASRSMAGGEQALAKPLSGCASA